MKYDPALHHRRSIRLRGYDYSQEGAYFITICAHRRRCIFGHIENQEMVLNEYGQVAWQEWEKLPERWPHVELGAFQIMPNHVHGIIIIRDHVGAPLAGAQPPDHIAGAQPPDHIAGAQPPDHIAGAQPPDHVAGAQPPEHVAGAQPTEHIAGAQPPEHIAGAQPTEHVAGAQPPDHVAGAQPPDHIAGTQPPDHVAGTQPTGVHPNVPMAPLAGAQPNTGDADNTVPTARVPARGTPTGNVAGDDPIGMGNGLSANAPTEIRITQIQWVTKPTAGQIAGAYQSCVSTGCLKIAKSKQPEQILGKLWQRNFWEHIIRDLWAFDTISNYIITNPENWEGDKFYSLE